MTDRPLLVWFPGVSWDQVRGTDRRLVEELALLTTVLWCDPPRSAWRYRRGELREPLDSPLPQVFRLRIRALPLSSRLGIRDLTTYQTQAAVRGAVRALGRPPVAQVVASPGQRFVPGLGGTKIFHVTDDWVDGATLMGLDRHWILRNMRCNGRSADVVTAVSEVLLRNISALSFGGERPRFLVVANGCDSAQRPLGAEPREPVAGLVGQLNERLDLDRVEAVVDAGIPLRIIGPRTDRARSFGRRLGKLLESSGVEYVGPVPAEEIPTHLARLGAGITPYTLTRFNLASFPLKTLEYLAAGLGVVSTDLPAVRWLDTDHVAIGRTPEEFAEETRQAIGAAVDEAAERDRRIFASQHSWGHRAHDLLDGAGIMVPRSTGCQR